MTLTLILAGLDVGWASAVTALSVLVCRHSNEHINISCDLDPHLPLYVAHGEVGRSMLSCESAR